MFSLRFTILVVVTLMGFGTNDASGYYVIPYSYDSPYESYPKPVPLTTTVEPLMPTTIAPPTTAPPAIVMTTLPPTTTMQAPQPVTTPTPPVMTEAPPVTPVTPVTPVPATTKCPCETKSSTPSTEAPIKNPDDGISIKYYRQYNYYYPSGERVSVNKPVPVKTDEIPEDSLPIYLSEPNVYGQTRFIVNSFQETDVNPEAAYPLNPNIYADGRVVVQTVKVPASESNIPADIMYLPNPYVYSQTVKVPALESSIPIVYSQSGLRLRQSAPLRKPKTNKNKGQNPPAQTKETNPAPAKPAESTDVTLDNIQKDIVTYLSDPNVFGETRVTLVKSDSSPYIGSQQISTSSIMQSQSGLLMAGNPPNIKKQGAASPSALSSASPSASSSVSSSASSSASSSTSTSASTLPLAANAYNPYAEMLNRWYNYPQASYQYPNSPPIYSVVV